MFLIRFFRRLFRRRPPVTYVPQSAEARQVVEQLEQGAIARVRDYPGA